MKYIAAARCFSISVLFALLWQKRVTRKRKKRAPIVSVALGTRSASAEATARFARSKRLYYNYHQLPIGGLLERNSLINELVPTINPRTTKTPRLAAQLHRPRRMSSATSLDVLSEAKHFIREFGD